MPWPFIPLDEHMTALMIGFAVALGTFVPLITGGLLGLNAPIFVRAFGDDESVFAIFDGYRLPLLGYLLSFAITYGLFAILLRTGRIQTLRRSASDPVPSYRGAALAAAAWFALLALAVVLPVGH